MKPIPQARQEAIPSLNPAPANHRHTSSEVKVFLVGAGPGDAELLTLRAARLLQCADVIVYDHLVSDDVLNYAAPHAQRIYVGKQTNCHTLPQQQINQLLVDLAKQYQNHPPHDDACKHKLAIAGTHQVIVRLKGGDPFIFGRGGEEVEALAEQGIAFEVVPGITAASGVASYAGIPLTHRDFAQSCVFTTGHLKDGSLNLDWDALSRPHQTVVIYMGLQALPEITRQFLLHGAPENTPVALVEQGTSAQQRVLCGTLTTITDLCRALGLKSPSLIIIGQVVTLHRKLHWFHKQRDQ